MSVRPFATKMPQHNTIFSPVWGGRLRRRLRRSSSGNRRSSRSRTTGNWQPTLAKQKPTHWVLSFRNCWKYWLQVAGCKCWCHLHLQLQQVTASPPPVTPPPTLIKAIDSGHWPSRASFRTFDSHCCGSHCVAVYSLLARNHKTKTSYKTELRERQGV